MIKYEKNMALLVALVLVALLSSCSDSPKYLDMLPDDAITLVRLDVKQMTEQSNFEKGGLKDKMLKLVAEDNMPAEAKKQIEKVVKDPAELGIDLRVPMMVSVTADQEVTLFAEMHNADKLKDFIKGLNAENSKKLTEKDGFTYYYANRAMIAFNDDVFCFGAAESQTEQEAIDKMKDLFSGKVTKMKDRKDVQKLLASDGIAQMLIFGEALGSLPMAKQMTEMMPKGVNMKDASFLLNLSSQKGKASLSYEVITDSKEWKDYIAKSDEMVKPIDADYLEYISKDGFALMANCAGEKLLNYLQDSGMLNIMDGEQENIIKPFLSSLDGNIVVGIDKIDENSAKPSFVMYAKTKNDSFSKLANENFGTMGEIGYKDNTTYIIMSNTEKPMTPTKNGFSKGDVKGSLYCYVNFDLFKPVINMSSGMDAIIIKSVYDVFSTAELYYLGEGKCELTVSMRDSDKYPLEKISDYIVSEMK